MPTVEEIRSAYADNPADQLVEGRFVVVGSQLRDGRNGQFAVVELRDPTGALTARAFDAELVELVGSASAIDATLRVGTFNGNMSTVIQRGTAAELDEQELLRFAGLDVDVHAGRVAEVRGWLEECSGTPWGDVLDAAFAGDVWRRFAIAPAAVKMHHAEAGGLVRHVVEVGRAGLALLESTGADYDRAYFLAGVLLHDIGKVDTYTEPPEIAYTAEGQLGEHQVWSTFRTGKACAAAGASRQVEARLVHIIEQAHGAYRHAEWQDPVGIEVKALASADYFSSRLGQTERERRAATALDALDGPDSDGAGSIADAGAAASTPRGSLFG